MSDVTRTRTDPRISRRRRAIERSRRRRVLVSLAVVAFLGAATWLAFWSPLLSVNDVVVVGGTHVSEADVVRAAGLDATDNLLLLSTGRVAAEVERLPWVASAKVDRKLPGTVRVRVVERRPRVTLVLADERWLLDGRGNVLERGTKSFSELPVMVAAGVTAPAPGAHIRSEEVQDALAVLRSLSRPTRREVAAVLAPSSERITLSLRDGTQIRFGAAGSLRAKNEVLDTLFEQMKREGRAAAYIDVRVPTSPAISNQPPVAATTTPVGTPAATATASSRGAPAPEATP